MSANELRFMLVVALVLAAIIVYCHRIWQNRKARVRLPADWFALGGVNENGEREFRSTLTGIGFTIPLGWRLTSLSGSYSCGSCGCKTATITPDSSPSVYIQYRERYGRERPCPNYGSQCKTDRQCAEAKVISAIPKLTKASNLDSPFYSLSVTMPNNEPHRLELTSFDLNCPNYPDDTFDISSVIKGPVNSISMIASSNARFKSPEISDETEFPPLTDEQIRELTSIMMSLNYQSIVIKK